MNFRQTLTFGLQLLLLLQAKTQYGQNTDFVKL